MFDTERLIIFLGDFNCVLSACDKTSEVHFRDASTIALSEIVNDYGLDDVCERVIGYKSVRYTHFQGNSHARLDMVYVSLELLRLCRDYDVTPVSLSDLCLVSVTLRKKKNATDFSWGVWKLNDHHLSDWSFTEFVTDALGKIEIDAGMECGVKWERFKEVLKMKAIEISCEIANSKRMRQSLHGSYLRYLTEEECQSPGSWSDDIRAVKSKLEIMDNDRFQGALIRARVQKLLFDVAPTKKALSTEKRYACQNHIIEIESNGRLTCDGVEIRTAFYDFHRNLFSCHPVEVDRFKDDFLSLLPQINDDIKLLLELPISVEEVIRANSELNNGKSPGPDGITEPF